MKRKNSFKILVVVLALLIVNCFGNTNYVKAEGIGQASYYAIGSNINGVLAEGGDDKVYYMFYLPESGAINISGAAYMSSVNLYLFDASANELWESTQWWNSTSEVISVDETIYLTSGTYYFCVGRYSAYGNFNFKIDFTSANESFTEINGGSNNTINTASKIETNGISYNAQIAKNDEKDFFQFQLGDSGKVKFDATFYQMKYVYWKLYDQNGEELCYGNPSWNVTTKNIVVDEELYLTSGIYYLAISKDYSEYGKYSFSILFTSSDETYSETAGGSNNSLDTASQLVLEKGYKGQLAINDDKDFYRFELTSDQTVTVSLEMQAKYVYVKLFDAKGNEIWSNNPSWNSVTEKIDFKRITTLNQGTYYLAIVKDGGRSGDYSLEIARLTQKNCPHEKYSTQYVASTYFAKGYTKYTCETCGYTIKKDYKPVLTLSQGYIYNYYVSSNKVTLYWYTQSDATGYQIRYSRNKSFSSGITTKTIKGSSKYYYTISKLGRNKKYYFQVRPYKKSGSKTVYGKWSAKKVLRTN